MNTGCGETAKRQLLSHLLYMDDLKLYGKNPDQLKGLLHTIRTFSDDIQMNFGLEKWPVAHFVNSKLSGHNSRVMVGKMDTITCLEPGQVYKYLGVDESNSIQHSTMRRRSVVSTFVESRWFSGQNKILAINGFALPVLTYGFGVIGGTRTCSSWIDKLRNFSLCTVYTILQQTLTGCTLRAPRAVEGYNRSRQRISLVLWGWTVNFVAALISHANGTGL